MRRLGGRPDAAGVHGTTLAAGLLGGLIIYGFIRGVSWLADWPHVWGLLTNADHAIYMQQAQRILAGGPLYPAFELAGPFTIYQLPELYPPIAVYGLFVPMALLPAPVWWLIPLAIVAWVVVQHRPSMWGWVVILACLMLPPKTWVVLTAGNPVIWVTAALALATRWGWVGPLVLLKPTIAPFVLIGIRSRGWWLMLALLAAVSLLLLPAWLDYARVLGNFRPENPFGILTDLPLVAIPLVAWLARPNEFDRPAAWLAIRRAGAEPGVR